MTLSCTMPQEDPLETQKLSISHFCGKNVLIARFLDPQDCSKILKDANQKQQVYIGPMSWEEAKDMRETCYASTVTAKALEERFAQAGGVPCILISASDSVLEDVGDQQSLALDDHAISPQRIDSAIVSSESNSLWSLYDLVPDGSYTNF